MTSPQERLAVAVAPGPERTRVRVSGEIDMDDAAEVRADLTAALDASLGGLDVDLAAVTICDSSGLHVLLDMHQLALDVGKTLVLTALSRSVARLLHITGAQDVLTVRNTAVSVTPHSEVRRPGVEKAQTGQARPMDVRMRTRRYGPTAHLDPTGELDLDTRSALDGIQEDLTGVDVVACNMGRLTFLDVVGLHALLDLVRRLDEHGIAFFAYNWQPQPRRLLDFVDSLCPQAGRGSPTRMLRSLKGFAAAARETGAAGARQDAPQG
ncbi:anti-sigma factor antagonist [Streptomyces sp. NPDC047014]|uniref:anti-sigma factor antagonist n=1 Tax=Streptomyces sp. NPDC047014 TaxID=3155736 RepID=UPI0033C12ABE